MNPYYELLPSPGASAFPSEFGLDTLEWVSFHAVFLQPRSLSSSLISVSLKAFTADGSKAMERILKYALG